MRISDEPRATARVGSERNEDSGLHRSGSWVRRARILVIDDEPLLGRTLSFMLEENHDVVVATSGREALAQLAKDARFDLLLCDLDMPGVNGCEIHTTLTREHPELLPRFVLMTGGACTTWAEDFMARYAGAHLEKPFTAADVEQVLLLVS